jgi:histidinol-phosphatase
MGALADDRETLLETALIAARGAGDLLLHQFSRPQHVEQKADGSIVTGADMASERHIKELITARHPQHTFVGEETGRSERGSRFTWVIDPLDGTKNFLRGVPLFSVEIALLKDGLPYVGVSNLPMMGDLIWAVRGQGAHSDSGNVRVSRTKTLNAAYVSFGNLKHFERACRLAGLLSLLKAASQGRGIGDSWSFHLLARGSVDIFADARTAFWDIAALAVIIEEAGGVLTDLDGGPISPYSNSVLASNAELHTVALSHLRSSM